MHPLSQFGLITTHSLTRDVEVYVFDTSAQDVTSAKNVLADAEWRHAQSTRSSETRKSYIRSRLALRQTLAWLSGNAPVDLDIRIGEKGKPYLYASNVSQPPQFSLSHSGQDLAIAVGRDMPVGIDIERRNQSIDALSVAEHFFCRDQLQQLQALRGSQRQDAFLRMWVRKEAAAKATGLGLGLSPSQINPIGPVDPHQAGSIELDGRRFLVIDLPASERLVGAVAIDLGADA